MDTTIKALSEDRFGGYLVVWGDASRKDLTGEWFDKDTSGLTDFFKAVGKLPALYDHARDGKMQTTAVGLIDTINPDDVGLWAEGEYARRNRYVAAVKEMVAKGALSFSSGALPQAVKRRGDGYIQNWPIIEGSMTPMPAEPRFTHIAALKSAHMVYKALGLPTDALPQEVVDESAQDSTVDDDEATAGKGVVEGSEESGENKVTPEEIQAAIDAALAKRDEKAKLDAKAAADLEAEIEKRATAKADEKIAAARGNGKSLPVPKTDGDGRIQVTRATKYSELSAAGMSFLYTIMSGMKSWHPDEEFYREVADKSFKAVQKGELPFDAIKGLNDLGFIKSNELDYSTQANYGDEWVPDGWCAELILKVRQENVIANKLQMIEMSTNPYELPIESGDPTVYTVPETTDQAQLALTSGNATPESKPGTGKITLTATKLGLRLAWSTEFNEDSIIPVTENYLRQSIRAIQDAIDNVCLNGDTEPGATGNINLVDSTPAATAKYMAQNGFRKFCLVTNTSQKKDGGGAPTLAMMRTTRFLMTGKYALQPNNCLWIVGNSTYAALLNFPEFLTMDKIGPQATALTGQVGVIDGVPVVATAEQALSNTAGKISVTGGNNTKGQAVIIFRPAWYLGYARQVTASVDKIGWADAYHLYVNARIALVPFDTGCAAEVYDLTV